LTKILDNAESVIEGIELFDPSCWEADCNNFPKSNDKEYKESRNK
jgi:hypothetical protein